MSYTELIRAAPLAAYAENRDLVAEMPNIVRRAQEYVVMRLDHDAFWQKLPRTTVGKDGVIDDSNFPNDLMEVRSVRVRWRSGDRWYSLLRRDSDMLSTLYTDDSRGPPKVYSDGPDGLVAYPRPGRVIDAEVRANVAPAILSPTVQTNLFTDKYPQVIENAVVREAGVFMLDAKIQQTYGSETDAALAAANAQIARQKRDESAQRPVETRNAGGA